MAITWRDDLAVGVYQIDQQHKTLFGKVDSLFEACNSGKGRDEIGGMLKYLGDYVVEHFTAEEAIMREHRYPGFPKHKEVHNQFVADFKALKAQFEKEGANANIVIQLNKLLIEWLLQHIKKMDKEVAAFINNK